MCDQIIYAKDGIFAWKRVSGDEITITMTSTMLEVSASAGNSYRVIVEMQPIPEQLILQYRLSAREVYNSHLELEQITVARMLSCYMEALKKRISIVGTWFVGEWFVEMRSPVELVKRVKSIILLDKDGAVADRKVFITPLPVSGGRWVEEPPVDKPAYVE